jgi:hypothetical protein
MEGEKGDIEKEIITIQMKDLVKIFEHWTAGFYIAVVSPKGQLEDPLDIMKKVVNNFMTEVRCKNIKPKR